MNNAAIQDLTPRSSKRAFDASISRLLSSKFLGRDEDAGRN